jgi:hypothetical protein
MPKVLIAEDDLMTADSVAETLVESGYEVCGIARTVADAVELGRLHNPDFARWSASRSTVCLAAIAQKNANSDARVPERFAPVVRGSGAVSRTLTSTAG